VTLGLIKETKTIFWDFDGVIKESVEVKSDVYESLFLPFGDNIANKVRKHHEEYGGMSRYDKLPIYLKWSNQNASQQIIAKYSQQFSDLAVQRVIDSKWVPGVLSYLQNNYERQNYFLITSTPQDEIEYILSNLEIAQFFKKIIGAPTNKTDALEIMLKDYSIMCKESIMIGDSRSDYDAATGNGVPFILRKTALNVDCQKRQDIKMILDFCE
jgi:phosphoglycolate phosphatase-like HAD superfamily hydrolase